jgi:hypothetical protein
MLNRRATAALVLTIAATGCGNNPAVPFVGPPATSTPSPTPAATPVGATPTPTPTPTATPVGATPTPTPTATPVGATPTPTPTPTPTATPSPTPTPVPATIVPAPASLAFTGLGAPNAQSFSVTESGYAGTFSEGDSCTGIATIVTASPTFTVTPVAVGTCAITVLDIQQHHVAVAVTVTTSGLVVQQKNVHR